jgi:uncharacterized iron-regulated membrane protein
MDSMQLQQEQRELLAIAVAAEWSGRSLAAIRWLDPTANACSPAGRWMSLPMAAEARSHDALGQTP